MKKIIDRLIPAVKLFLTVMIIAVVDSAALHYLLGQTKSKYILESALSYHQKFAPMLKAVQANRRAEMEISSSRKRLAPGSASTPVPSSIPTPPPTISEIELYRALTDYRFSHGRSNLVLEENLCVYARRRVSEHLKRLETLGADDKPLDNHAGFTRDADSGEVFKITDMKAVAENLAYLPVYTTATQIVEWGWDTSTAHRDAQLSNEWTHVCLSGKYPFYVGIFGHR